MFCLLNEENQSDQDDEEQTEQYDCTRPSKHNGCDLTRCVFLPSVSTALTLFLVFGISNLVLVSPFLDESQSELCLSIWKGIVFDIRIWIVVQGCAYLACALLLLVSLIYFVLNTHFLLLRWSFQLLHVLLVFLMAWAVVGLVLLSQTSWHSCQSVLWAVPLSNLVFITPVACVFCLCQFQVF